MGSHGRTVTRMGHCVADVTRKRPENVCERGLIHAEIHWRRPMARRLGARCPYAVRPIATESMPVMTITQFLITPWLSR